MKKTYINHKLEGYNKPLYEDHSHGMYQDGVITHCAKITYPVFKMLNLREDGYRWDDDFWCEIGGETEKAIYLEDIGWVPKKMIIDVREIIREA